MIQIPREDAGGPETKDTEVIKEGKGLRIQDEESVTCVASHTGASLHHTY